MVGMEERSEEGRGDPLEPPLPVLLQTLVPAELSSYEPELGAYDMPEDPPTTYFVAATKHK